MKKNCPFHKEYNLKVFCTEEECEGYRLMCLKCTITSEIKDVHKDHQLILIKDLFKKLEKVKSERGRLPSLQEHILGGNLDSTSKNITFEDNIEMKASERLSCKEISQLLCSFRSLQRIINEPALESIDGISKSNLTQVDVELEGDQPKQSLLRQSKKFKTTDPKKTIQPSIGVYLSEKLSFQKQKSAPISSMSFDGVSISTQESNLSEALNKLCEPKKELEEALIDSACQSSTKPNTETGTASSSGKKSKSWEADQGSFTFQPSTIDIEGKRSIGTRSVTRSATKRAQEEAAKTSITKFETIKDDECSNTDDKPKKEKKSTKKSVGKKAAQVTQQPIKIEDETAQTKVRKPHSIDASNKPSLSAMDLLKQAISKLTNTCLKDITNTIQPVEEKYTPPKWGSNKKSPIVCASDVYRDTELEEEARNLVDTEFSNTNLDLQQELKKQVTGMKEFLNYNQKTGHEKIKLKELKEMWKDLPKKERDQWNSIALRKRIELRDQVESQKKDKSKFDSCYDLTYKKSKTTSF